METDAAVVYIVDILNELTGGDWEAKKGSTWWISDNDGNGRIVVFDGVHLWVSGQHKFFELNFYDDKQVRDIIKTCLKSSISWHCGIEKI